jgi:hypothetical protein
LIVAVKKIEHLLQTPCQPGQRVHSFFIAAIIKDLQGAGADYNQRQLHRHIVNVSG